MSKKILIYAPILGRGGVTRVVEKLSKSWIDLGCEITYLGSPLNEHHVRINLHPRINVVQLDGGQSPQHPKLWEFLEKNRREHYNHMCILSKEHDLVFLPMPWHTMRQAYWNPYCTTFAYIPDFAHDYIPGILSEKQLVEARRECFNFSKYCNGVIFSSDFQREWGRNKYGMSRGRTWLVRKPGFIPDNFDVSNAAICRFRETYDVPREFLLAVHIFGHKDPTTLLKGYIAAKTIMPDLPPLVLAGIHSELFNPAKSTKDVHARMIQGLIVSSSLDWKKNLRFLGYIPEELLGGMYASAMATIVTSKSEGGVPGVICESAAANTPIIYSNIPAHTEILGDEENGIYGNCFQVENSGELALAICRAHQNYNKGFEKTGETLNLKVGHPHWEDIGETYLKIFEGN